MIAPNNIHPPKNWQDFEMLCLKLWGELWSVPHEIEFNSDNAQGQQGVDIYAPINNGISYNGIQCKNKKLNKIDGSPNRITIQDIQTEIDKAKLFKPALSKLIIATSLPKDQQVEEYVRVKSVEHAQNNLFTIQICFWDFFERKIPEFQNIHDWYLKNENFHRVREISVTFEQGGAELTVHPKYKKTITNYTSSSSAELLNKMIQNQPLLFRNFGMVGTNREVDWEQYCWLYLSIKNTGKTVIEDFKIELDFEGEFVKVGVEKPDILNLKNFKSNVKEYSNTDRSLLIQPYETHLVQDDGFLTKGIFIQPKIGLEARVKVKWKLLSRDFNDEGELSILVSPKYHVVREQLYVEDESLEKEDIEIALLKRTASFVPFNGFDDDESQFNFE